MKVTGVASRMKSAYRRAARGRRAVGALLAVCALSSLTAPVLTPVTVAAEPSLPPSSPFAGKDPATLCGLNLAMVLDVSPSIDEDEMNQIRNAVYAAVDQLAGTPTTLSLYLFSGDSPVVGYNNGVEFESIVLDTEENLREVREHIGRLEAYNSRIHRGEVGTNWASGFRRVAEGNFDAAIFMTDGALNLPYGAGQADEEDLRLTFDWARKAKAKSSIYTVAVGLNKDPAVVWQPLSLGALDSTAELYTLNEDPTPYDVDDVYIGNVYLPEQVRWFNQGGRWQPFTQPYKSYFEYLRNPPIAYGGDEPGILSVPAEKEGDIQQTQCYNDSTGRYEACWYLRDARGVDRWVYKANLYKPLDVLNTVSNDVAVISDFSAIQDKILSRLSGCEGTVTVRKSVAMSDGTEVPDANAGFSFVADHVLVNGQIHRDVRRETNDRGLVVFDLVSKGAPAPESGTVFIVEESREGYSLAVKDGRAATCTALTKTGPGGQDLGRYQSKDVEYISRWAEGSPDKVWISFTPANSTGWEGGFKVRNVEKTDRVICDLTNTKTPRPEFSIAKEAVGDEPVVGNDTETVTATYKLTVTNTSTDGGVPDRIVDAPKALPGLKITNITVNPKGPGATEKDLPLIEQPVEVNVTDATAPEVVLPSEKLMSFAAKQTRIGFVTVTYAVENKTKLAEAAKTAGTCEATESGTFVEGHGLVNAARLELTTPTGTDTSNAEGCTPITVTEDARFTLAKTPTTRTVTINPGSDGEIAVAYTLAVTNTSGVSGKPVSLTDTPATIPGLKAARVTAHNPKGADGLLDGDVTITQNNSLELETQQLVEIPAGKTRVVDVTVIYTRENNDELRASLTNPETTTCVDGNQTDGRGLINRARVTGPVDSVDADACTSITGSKDAAPTLEKSVAPGQKAPIITPGGSATVEYLVKVLNPASNLRAVSLPALVDTPSPVSGISVTGVTASNPTQPADQEMGLLKGDSAATLTLSRNGSYRLAGRQLKSIPPGTTGVVRLAVTYKAADSFGDHAKGANECQDNGTATPGTGLFNAVTAKGTTTANKDNTACVSVFSGRITVTKNINGSTVTGRDAATPIPADRDSVRIGYLVTNDSTAALASMSLADFNLTGADELGSAFPELKSLSCGRNASVSGSEVSFPSLLAPGASVDCSWELPLEDIDPQYVVRGVHGDEVTVTPRFVDPNNPNEDPTVGTPAKSRSWMRIPSTIQVTKTALAKQVIVVDEDNEVDVDFLVEVTNTGRFPASTEALVDSPALPKGVTVTSVIALPAGDKGTAGARELVPAGASYNFHEVKNGYLLSLRDKGVQTLEGKQTLKFVARMRLDVSGIDRENPSESLMCTDDDNSRGGVFNTVAFGEGNNPPIGTDCTSITVGRSSVSKTINDQQAPTRESAVPVFTGDPVVRVAYTVTNTGTAPIQTVSLQDEYLHGPKKGEPVVGSRAVTCEIPGNPARSVTPTDGVIDLGQNPLAAGQSIVCRQELTDEEMAYDAEGLHANRVTAIPSYHRVNNPPIPGSPTSDDGWAQKVGPLTGRLPDTGSPGLVLVNGAGLLLALAGVAWRRRNTRCQ